MKTYFFVFVLLVCLCVCLGLKPGEQNHKLVNGQLGTKISHDSLQRQQQHTGYQTMNQNHKVQNYQQSTTQDDDSSTTNNGMNHKSLFSRKTSQNHKLFNDDSTSSQSYHQHQMYNEMSSYDDGTENRRVHRLGGLMRNRHHLMEGDPHDEFSQGDYENNNNDDQNFDELNDNYQHNQNDLDEPNNGQRTYYVDDDDLRKGMRQADTDSVKARDYIDYNKEIHPQRPSDGVYTPTPRQRQWESKSSKNYNHDYEKLFDGHNNVNEQTYHDANSINDAHQLSQNQRQEDQKKEQLAQKNQQQQFSSIDDHHVPTNGITSPSSQNNDQQ